MALDIVNLLMISDTQARIAREAELGDQRERAHAIAKRTGQEPESASSAACSAWQRTRKQPGARRM